MNEITDITETSGTAWPAPAHDASGNMTSAPRPLDLGNSFDLTWDAWNRLVEVGNGSATVATYRYDGASRRVSKDDGTHTRHYYYSDSWQVLEERLDAGTSADRQYVWGVKSIDDLILRDDTGLRLYALNDAMGSVTAVVDTSGSVQERYGYNGFGAPWYMDATYSPRTSSDYDWEKLFDGYRYDTDTGLYQVRYRYLHPKLGRWLKRDPLRNLEFAMLSKLINVEEQHRSRLPFAQYYLIIEEWEGQNLYGFVYNKPIIQVDAYGLYTFRECQDICGAFFSGAGQGLAATVDGALPFVDPLASAGAYDSTDPVLQSSQTCGAIASCAAGGVSALRGAAALGATRTGVGHWLNHGRYWRIGPGNIPKGKPFTCGPGQNVPTLRFGSGPPRLWNHFDLRSLGH